MKLTANIELSETDKRELIDLTTVDVIRRLVGGLGVTTKIPSIGEMWPCQGGVYAGIIRPDDGSSPFHLIYPNDADGENASIAWGGYGEDEPGATSLWDGKANTIALVNSEHDHPAAQWAHGLVLAGHSDWYMAAQRELMLGWINVPELFAKEWYLASTQSSSNDAWYQYFGNGGTYDTSKGTKARVRAVRRLPL